MGGVVDVINDQRYRWGSNFWPCTIVRAQNLLWGTKSVKWDFATVFRSSEQYYMWYKSNESGYRHRIMSAETPYQAKKIGSYEEMKKNGYTLQERWDKGEPPYKIKVMTRVVIEKFTQNAHLAILLMETDDREIIEGAPWDSFWGTGKDGKGENHLGKVLMSVRTQLQDKTLTPISFKEFRNG